MEKHIKFIASITIFLLYVFSFSLLGFLIAPGKGELVGFVLSLGFLAILVLFADRFFLALISAKPMWSDRRLINLASSLSLRMGLKEVGLFRSYKLPENIYCLDSMLGGPAIIISGDFEKHLKDEELEILLYEAFKKIQSSQVKQNLLIALMVGIISAPKYFFSQWRFTQVFSIVYGFYLIPLEMLKDFIVKSNSLSSFFDESDGESRWKYAGFFKIMKQKYQEKTFINEISKDLVLVDTYERSLWNTLTGSYPKMNLLFLKSKFEK